LIYRVVKSKSDAWFTAVVVEKINLLDNWSIGLNIQLFDHYMLQSMCSCIQYSENLYSNAHSRCCRVRLGNLYREQGYTLSTSWSELRFHSIAMPHTMTKLVRMGRCQQMMLSKLPEEAHRRLQGQKIRTAKNIDDKSKHIRQDGCSGGSVALVMRITDITNEINRPGPS
jgi:GTPase SAR1 family protein